MSLTVENEMNPELLKKLLAHAKAKEAALVSGLCDGAGAYLACCLAGEMKDRLRVYVFPNELKCREALDDFRTFGEEPLWLPSRDTAFYVAQMGGAVTARERIRALSELTEGRARALLVSAECFLDIMPSPEEWKSFRFSRRIGQKLDLEAFLNLLIAYGYERRDMVEGPGQFSLRGGIIDIYGLIEDVAWRIELWDDEIDTIRELDTETQRSGARLESFTLYPATEFPVNAEQKKKGFERIHCAMKKAPAFTLPITEESAGNSLNPYIPFFYDNTVQLSAYLPEDAVFMMFDPLRIREKLRVCTQEMELTMKGRLESGYILPEQMAVYASPEQVETDWTRFGRVLLCNLLSGNSEAYPVSGLYSVSSHPESAVGYFSARDLFLEDLRTRIGNGYKVHIFVDSTLTEERLGAYMQEEGLRVSAQTGKLHYGFSLAHEKLLVLSLNLSEGKQKKNRKKRKGSGAITSFSDLKVGDYVVHENHGVGLYQGIVQMADGDSFRDYFKIAYRDGGVLYVPTTSLDMLERYIASENAAPKLNRLGGAEWGRTKARVKAGVKELAEGLIKLYAARKARPGFAFSKDTIWQKEFEDMFPFEETGDQLAAIEDTKRDMEQPIIMDRLICGDVGYGKTEIAIRAAFKCVQDGKQVAMLAPTTILAEQHYHTFTSRMKAFPVRVELLSRFCTPAQVKKTIEDTKRGLVDIVIGTHRLLSQDVAFKNLGLLIVDEEQRFGVQHKEKMKALKEDVDVLTLTATPIPRTLHMSISGIRDMSLLEEAPQDRQPIQTYVMEEEEPIVREAIYREMARGGQVFYLYNRVQTIAECAAGIQNIVPEARVAVAHGQMSERELENVMHRFVEGEVDVLVCTTIVETGLDIANVNTIIIHDADAMGLAQLYQLRGRVGRSSRLAYCYLMYKKGKILQETAQKRLEAISEFTEFGSGFKVALRDLEIRGAGNVLGAEQHGHMGAVGYELYCKLLEEEMMKQRGEEVRESFETTVRIRVNAYLPAGYIPNEGQKLDAYRKIASIRDEEDYLAMQEELLDRYGDLPQEVMNLLDITLVKALCNAAGIALVEYAPPCLRFTGKKPEDGSKPSFLSLRIGTVEGERAMMKAILKTIREQIAPAE